MIVAENIVVDIYVKRKSVGHDYFVRITCGDRIVTPYRFTERYAAEYEAAHFEWLFGIRADMPALMDYDAERYPNQED